MHSMENMGTNTSSLSQEEKKKDSLSEKVYFLMKDFPPTKSGEKEMRAGEKRLDAEMAKMSREELINLAMDIRQRLEDPESSFADENMYLRFATVYGAACTQLERLEEK